MNETEPMLIWGIRKDPTGDVRHNRKGGGALGTSAAGFLAEYDEALREAQALAWDAAIRQAIEWLRAGYEYGTGPDWRENGAEWIAERAAEARLATPTPAPRPVAVEQTTPGTGEGRS